jgi:hypothetical protein
MSAESALASAPWTAEDFDPARAWALVTALRTERDTERAAREVAESGDALVAARDELASVRRQLYVERAGQRHGVDPDDVGFFTRGAQTEDEILAVAARLGRAAGAPTQPVSSPRFLAAPR